MVPTILPLHEKQSLIADKFPYKTIFYPSFRSILKNIIYSFIPPFFSRFNRIAVDLIGPIAALVLLIIFLNITYLSKPNKEDLISPTRYMITFGAVIVIMSYFLCKLVGKSRLLLCEIISLLGYYLYSHIITLTLASLLMKEDGRDFFYIMIFCSSTSTFRVVMILSRSMRIPVLRFIVTTFVVIMLLLGLISQYFIYVQPRVL